MANQDQAAAAHDTYITRALATPDAHLRIGPFGFTLHFSRAGRQSGYDSDMIKAECMAAGLPIVDTRDMPFEARHRLTAQAALVAVGETPDDPPWHG